MSTVISVRLPKVITEQIDTIAKETERPRSYIVQKILEFYTEDYSDLQVAICRLNDKTDSIISSKEMRKSLGL